jgi:nanoRNase/pAp phosphatase (c-di-AMP/oligoRNAs hydrolase)
MKLSGVKTACIVTHRLADVDAYCSVYSLASLLRYYKSIRDIHAIFPDGLNSLACRVKEYYNLSLLTTNVYYKYTHDININADIIIIADTNNPIMLGDAYKLVVESKCDKVIIDHHAPYKDIHSLAGEVIIDTDASSTCELVYRLFKERRIKVSKDVAGALLLGILTDSQHLTIARCKSIEVVSMLCRSASIEDARSILAVGRDYSEKVARLKAAQRCRLYKANGFIIAFSKVGSYHASAAKALIDLGADLAVVTSTEGTLARASVRSTQEFYAKTRLHLGTDLLATISDAGGGHPTAASIALECSEEELCSKIMDIIRDRVGRLDPL